VLLDIHRHGSGGLGHHGSGAGGEHLLALLARPPYFVLLLYKQIIVDGHLSLSF